MDALNKGSLDVLVPRSLITDGVNFLDLSCNEEGLSPVRIVWESGKIKSLAGIRNSPKSPGKILLPRFAEVHTHLDKAFTWQDFPNYIGTYQNALDLNLNEHKRRTSNGIKYRAEKALNLALKNGIRAIRTHVDSLELVVDQSWDVLIELKKKWKPLIDIQLVALVPLEYWESPEGEILLERVSKFGGLLGGVVSPPFNGSKTSKSLIHLIRIANQIGCGIDLHIDESDLFPGAGLKLLIKALNKIELKVPLTCSHSSSMSLLAPKALSDLADQLAFYKVNVVALPLTNAWLLGRNGRDTSMKRPLAPISQLQKAGVTVAIGGDNIKDPWFPLNGLDPIGLMAFSIPLAHLAPWQRLGLSSLTTSSARIMGLKWDGTFFKGSPADWVLLEADNWSEALSFQVKRNIIINGNFLEEFINLKNSNF